MSDIFENFPRVDEGVLIPETQQNAKFKMQSAECEAQNAECEAQNAECEAQNEECEVQNAEAAYSGDKSAAVDFDFAERSDTVEVEILDEDEKIIYKDFPDSSLDIDISPVHARFIDHYLVCGNKSKAAKLAGIKAESSSALRVKACRIFARDDVKAYYRLRKAEIAKKADISFESYMSELVSIATFDIKDAVETEVVNTLTAETVYSVHFKNIEDIPEFARKAVKSIEIAKDGTPKMIFYDKLAALKMIGEIKGYMKSSQSGEEDETGIVFIPEFSSEVDLNG